MNDSVIYKLIDEAKDVALQNFCCKHSGFTVGAALLTKDNKIYKGCNVENDGIQSICAERVAFVKALSEGSKEFRAIAVVGKKITDLNFSKTLPCGYCRQFMSEYVPADFIIYTYDDKEKKFDKYYLKDLLPESFSL